MILMVMMMRNTTMVSRIALCKVTTKSARQPLQLLRKSLNKLLPVLHLPLCLHRHRECLHWQEINQRHLWHRSALAWLYAARTHSDLWLIHLPTPNVNVELPCALVTYMVSSDTLLSNSGISKVPLTGDELWVRPLGPHYNNNNRTPRTMSWEVSPTPLLPPLRKMWKRCARKGEQT